MIWVRPEQKYFFKRGWTGDLQNCPTGKSPGSALISAGHGRPVRHSWKSKAAGVGGRFRIRVWRRMGATVSSRNDDDYGMSAHGAKQT